MYRYLEDITEFTISFYRIVIDFCFHYKNHKNEQQWSKLKCIGNKIRQWQFTAISVTSSNENRSNTLDKLYFGIGTVYRYTRLKLIANCYNFKKYIYLDILKNTLLKLVIVEVLGFQALLFRTALRQTISPWT